MKYSLRSLMIVALILPALLAALYWAVFDHQRGRAFRFWGGAAATTISDADKVELLTLTLKSKGGLLAGLEGFDVDQIKDISAASDLVHLRHSLLKDASFDWDLSAATRFTGSTVQHHFLAVRFSGRYQVVTIAFLDVPEGAVLYAEKGDEVILNQTARSSWKKLVNSTFP